MELLLTEVKRVRRIEFDGIEDDQEVSSEMFQSVAKEQSIEAQQAVG